MPKALNCGDKSYALPNDLDLDGLKAEIARAAQTGGMWVTITGQRTSVDLLVT